MEPNEAHELRERHEKASDESGLRPVGFAMSVLAVLVAITTVLDHRTHAGALLAQAQASDQWNEYQAQKIRLNETRLTSDTLSVLAEHDVNAQKLVEDYKERTDKWSDQLKEEEAKAHEFEAEFRSAERKGNRYDLGEVILEIGLVITSITLLTRQHVYWYLGMAFGIAGLAVCITALVL